MVIEYGQGMTALRGQREMTFEIHLPQLVRGAALKPLERPGAAGAGLSRPCRHTIAVMVLNAGTSSIPALRSTRPILRAPQAGWFSRTAITAASHGTAVRRG